jgi:CubicO group peptidase (beta-lactamase class C family)
MKTSVFKRMTVCFLSIFLAQALHAETTITQSPTKKSPETFAELKVELEKIRTETGTVAIGVSVVDQDGSVWTAGLGEANREKHIKADENSLFRIASASKMFAGLSVLKLVEEGKLHLTDKLHDLAPEIAFDNPWEATNPILIGHLLEHTTGWDTHTSDYAHEAPDSMSLQEGLADPIRIKARTSRWVPGTRHAYSNSGPVVAAYVVEKISHQKYEDFVQEHFFNPLQMNSSTFFKTAFYLEHAAIPYVNNKPQEYAQVYSRPSSSLNTSPADMAQLLKFFIQKGSINNQIILSPESIQSMQTPQTTLGAAQGITSGYGLTLQIFGNDNPNIALYGHSGGLPGAITEFAYIPEIKAGYVFMLTNGSGEAYGRIQQLIRGYLLKGVVNKPEQAIELPIKFQQLAGFYQRINPEGNIELIKMDIDGIMKFSVSDNRLHREPFFGGWRSSDYATNDKNLTNPYTGLPSIAIVQDPLAGELVQVEGSTYKKVSALSVYGRLALLISLAIFSATSILFALIWIPRFIFGKLRNNSSIQLRSLPLAANICLILLALVPIMLGDDILDFARLSLTSFSIFLLSIIYPFLSCYSLLVAYKNRTATMNSWLYWHSTLLAMLHVSFSVYVASYGLLALRLWA